MEKYSLVFDHDPENAQALAGIAWCLFMLEDRESVIEMLSQVPADQQGDRLKGLAFLLSLSGDIAALQSKLEKKPKDLAMRYEFAQALAGAGQLQAAVEAVVVIIEKDSDWQEGKAKEFLLQILASMGPSHPLTSWGRRKLSSVLFS